MDSAMAMNWLEMRRMPGTRVKVDQQIRDIQLARENIRLAEENERLRTENADLAASAQIWIRLYEAALTRANLATDVFGGLCQPAPRH